MGPEDDLLDRLERWLVAQPEWPALFGADRQTRRRTSEAVARRLYTLPARVQGDQVMHRAVRRELDRQLRKQVKEMQKVARENEDLLT